MPRRGSARLLRRSIRIDTETARAPADRLDAERSASPLERPLCATSRRPRGNQVLRTPRPVGQLNGQPLGRAPRWPPNSPITMDSRERLIGRHSDRLGLPPDTRGLAADREREPRRARGKVRLSGQKQSPLAIAHVVLARKQEHATTLAGRTVRPLAARAHARGEVRRRERLPVTRRSREQCDTSRRNASRPQP